MLVCGLFILEKSMKISKLVAPLRPCHDSDGMIKDIKINGLEEPIVVSKFGNGFCTS